MLYEHNLEVGSDYQSIVETIASSLLAGKCMFFLGAGASVGPSPSLPTASELSAEMATKCKLEWHEYIPLSTIAFYYESIKTREGLNSFIKERIDRKIDGRKIGPSPTIKKLMSVLRILEARLRPRQLPIFTITTNYDQQFEDAYEEEFKSKPEILIYKGAHDPHDGNAKLNCTPYGPLQDPFGWRPAEETKSVLYKMHGCISQPQQKGLVITEEDYINFLANALREHDPEKTLLTYIKAELGQRIVLFIGYSLSDWNFRAIFKGTVEKHKDREQRSYAVQFRNPASPLSALQNRITIFWHEKKVDILNANAESFMDDLMAAVQAEAHHGG